MGKKKTIRNLTVFNKQLLVDITNKSNYSNIALSANISNYFNSFHSYLLVLFTSILDCI